MVVAVDRDILGASGGASAGTDASPGGLHGRGAAEVPESDVLERAVTPASLVDASSDRRSSPRPPRVLHAVVAMTNVSSARQGERGTSSD